MFLAQKIRSSFLFRWSMLLPGKRHFASAKKKFAVNLRHKEGRQLALEHFDFYYKPIFRRRWPSIRLGLTSQSKQCAIVNNFGAESSIYCDRFEMDGALDLIRLLDEAKARTMEESGGSESRKQTVHKRGVDMAVEASEAEEAGSNTEQENLRSAATINQFILPTKFITRDTVPASHKEDERLPILDTWSRDNVQFIDDDVVYPKHLRAFAYPLGDVRKFDDSTLDDSTAVRSHMMMDVASLFPVLALDVRPEEAVLDLCAAPGEKALALLQTLIPCNLVCNDISQPRISLLRHNLCSYIQNNDDVRSRIRFLRLDGSLLKNDNIDAYDKVLVDVPNTEDRKSLRLRDDESNLFRRSMISDRLRLPDQQTEILIGGLKALRKGGFLVYTTSTLSPSQNDEVIETAFRRLQQDPDFDGLEFAVCDLEPLARDFYDAQILRLARRQCRYGQLVIPFLPNNYGPVYACKLKRID